MENNQYRLRRQVLAEKMGKNAFAVISSGTFMPASGDQSYPFEVNRNFYYFTGIDRPDMKLIVANTEGGELSTLFIPRKDPYKEKWTGYIPVPEEFEAISGISDMKYIDEFDSSVPSFVTSGSYDTCYLYTTAVGPGKPSSADNILAEQFRKSFYFLALKDLSRLTDPMRAIKSQEEKRAVIESGKITAEALGLLLRGLKPGMYEYEAQALFEYGVARRNASLAFNTICAGGKNATVLHYTANNCELKDGDMLLIDCGAALGKYNSDVTRTFPVNGKFTKRQKRFYDIVLEGNMLVAQNAKAGVSTYELNEVLKKYFVKELKAVNLIEEDNELEKYYYHSVSHSIGLDTHDPLGRHTPMAPGTIISDEPGLYIPEFGIGIRIEDDLFITENGCEVLTDVVKTTDEIEEVMRK